jgi:hypothetical protein
METNDKLKKFIFKKLYNDLSHVEIIPYDGSIWFIDRDNKYWYLQLEDNGTLWWRYYFFDRFFMAFSLEQDEYLPLIIEWVEEVLNHKVYAMQPHRSEYLTWVEEVLDYKVNTTLSVLARNGSVVEQVLNNKVNITVPATDYAPFRLEQVLNSK